MCAELRSTAGMMLIVVLAAVVGCNNPRSRQDYPRSWRGWRPSRGPEDDASGPGGPEKDQGSLRPPGRTHFGRDSTSSVVYLTTLASRVPAVQRCQVACPEKRATSPRP